MKIQPVSVETLNAQATSVTGEMSRKRCRMLDAIAAASAALNYIDSLKAREPVDGGAIAGEMEMVHLFTLRATLDGVALEELQQRLNHINQLAARIA